MTEIWKDISGYLGYKASDQGRITGKFGKVLKASKSSVGSWYVRPYSNGKPHNHSVGHLVLQAFCGPPPKGMEWCHGPKGRGCHELSNLSWGTHSKNQGEDRVRDGTSCHGNTWNRGEKCGAAKLKECEVLEIRRLRGKVFQSVIAKMFRVSQTQVCSVQLRKKWAWLL